MPDSSYPPYPPYPSPVPPQGSMSSSSPPLPPPPLPPKRTIGEWLRLILMLIGGVGLSCIVLGIMLNLSGGSTSSQEKTQTRLPLNTQSTTVPLASGGIGGNRLATPSISASEPSATSVSIGNSIEIGQWTVTVIDVSTAQESGKTASGQWIIIHGTITNNDKKHLIGKQELKLRTSTQTFELDRDASVFAAERLGVVPIGKVGGISLDKGDRSEWAIAFDVPRNSTDLWLVVEGVDAVQIDAVATVAVAPTATMAVPPSPKIGPLLISRTDFGSEWPFTVESGTIQCLGQAVIFTVDGVVYGVNGSADATERYQDIRPIWANNPAVAGLKISLGPIISYGLTRC